MRVLQPMRALSAVSGVACYISESGAAVLSPARGQTWSEIGPKIMILHRPIVAGREGYETLRNLLVRDFVVITEYDDHPDYVPLPAQIRAEDLLSFTGVHAIQTSTEPLAHVLRSRNPEVAVFRNSIEQAQVAHNFTNYGQLTLFYGCFNRQQDWCELVPTLNAVLKEARERLFVRVLADEAFFKALSTPNKYFVPPCDYETYLDLLSQSDIALMPLRDTPFNVCKSDLKFIEASAARVLSLASPVVYGESIDHGRTGLIFHTPQDLEFNLRAILANPDAARAMADAARSHVLATRMLNNQIQPRLDWYRELWQRRDVLTAALRARVPGL